MSEQRIDEAMGGHGGDFAQALAAEGERQWQQLIDEGKVFGSISAIAFVHESRTLMFTATIRTEYHAPSITKEHAVADLVERMLAAGFRRA